MSNKIISINIDEKSLTRSDRNKSARERAITDLLDDCDINIQNHSGPYNLEIEIVENKLLVHLFKKEDKITVIPLSLMTLKRVIKDYYIICESYFEAIKLADSRKVEAIDMGRRGVHNEGAEILQDLLPEDIYIEFETARKLFALIYLLQIK